MIGAGSTARQTNSGPHSFEIEQEIATLADGAAPTERAIAFGPFRILPTRSLLLKGRERVHLGSRALEILVALVERPGELVSKSELMARVWPDTFVEEGNLKVQVAGLRRALGDRRGSNRYLATIPGRGYRFVAPVSDTEELRPSTPPAAGEASHHLPAPVTAVVDRADSVAAITAHLPRQRFVTVVGPGGIGKTTVALAAARGMLDQYEHGVRFVDLTSVGDPRQMPGALVARLGLDTGAGNPDALIAALADKRMLLVLDNCEHVIEAVAMLVSRVLKSAPGLQILATSREPLRAEGEHVHRLPPLAIPPASPRLTAAEALSFPAVQLFVERAVAAFGAFELDDEDAPIVAEICRNLDGIPLAIELAAGRVDAFGLRGLAAHLDEPLQLLTGGRRSVLPRHASLRAALDWGHDLLPDAERMVLRRLAIFAGGFTLEAASTVAASAEITAAEVVECIANLVAKSLIAADVGGTIPCYCLPRTTRAYALERLLECGELEQVRGHYAEWVQTPARPIEAERDTPSTDRLAICGRRSAGIGVAQDWTFAPTDASRSAPPVSSPPVSFHR